LELKRGALTEAAAAFNCSPRSISRVWNKAVESMQSGGRPDVTSKLNKTRVTADDSELIKKIPMIPLNERSTYRGLAAALGVSVTKIVNMKNRGSIRRVTKEAKPMLTKNTKVKRLKHALASVGENQMFKSMNDVVHIDEKWWANGVCSLYIFC
jgi:hypothetical protein